LIFFALCAKIGTGFITIMKFTVYSKAGCPYCDKIGKVLELSKQEHTIKILDEDFTIGEYVSMFSSQTPFPQIILHDSVGDVYLGGCIETVKFLRQQNIII